MDNDADSDLLKWLADAPLNDPLGDDVETTPFDPAPTLFELQDWWEPLWQGMPEFDQRDLSAFCSLTVNFACQSDLEAFAETVGQKLTPKTRSIWFPPAEIGRYANKRYKRHEP